MLKLKYLLLTSVVIVVSNNVLASEIKLTFDDTGSPLVKTYTTHTPMELKPISHFNSDNAVKLAAVCAVGGGGCSGLEFGKSNNSMLLDKAAQCTDEGYAASCPSGYVLDYTKPCIYNKSYYKCRVCSHTCPAGSLNNCSSTQVLTGTTSNDCLETCYQCRDKTCAEGGYAVSINSCQNGTAVSFANKTCYKNVTAKTCENGGYKSTVPTNNKCDSTTYCSKTCYTNCKQPTCEDGGYKSTVPANNVCSDVTYYGRTCKKDCKQPTCEDGGYKSGVPNNQVCTPVTYYGRSCYQNCYQPQCTAGGYVSACPTNQIGTSVTYYGRNCYKNCYQPQCSAGGYLDTQPSGQSCNQIAYYGRNCYYNCGEILPILYSDMTISKTIISDKIPIGIVIDNANHLAVALEGALMLTFGGPEDNTSLEGCTSYLPLSCGTDGKANTEAIINFGTSNNLSYPAAEYCYNYTTPGTTVGDWHLPSFAELESIYYAKDSIDVTLNLLDKLLTETGTPYSGIPEDSHWSSTKYSAGISWVFRMDEDWGAPAANDVHTYVRPVIYY